MHTFPSWLEWGMVLGIIGLALGWWGVAVVVLVVRKTLLLSWLRNLSAAGTRSSRS
ncbi:MAG: hypothetical protein KatS3mg114_0651 [Planctomycetaceae bacterium]|nr:MAG: hypothetical protein KatS3mg114_0651 [Planctomycetaceae bacterium]